MCLSGDVWGDGGGADDFSKNDLKEGKVNQEGLCLCGGDFDGADNATASAFDWYSMVVVNFGGDNICDAILFCDFKEIVIK